MSQPGPGDSALAHRKRHDHHPKSVHADRQRENLDLFGFALTADEHAAIDALDGPTRAGHDPLTFTYA